mmetsp:Transcript_70582/g.199270  ORF Transcript_70582/g.199270 Transcript_70582/m.199270 type:complete len:251 (+) Transcript_70582:176-928(+)
MPGPPETSHVAAAPSRPASRTGCRGCQRLVAGPATPASGGRCCSPCRRKTCTAMAAPSTAGKASGLPRRRPQTRRPSRQASPPSPPASPLSPWSCSAPRHLRQAALHLFWRQPDWIWENAAPRSPRAARRARGAHGSEPCAPSAAACGAGAGCPCGRTTCCRMRLAREGIRTAPLPSASPPPPSPCAGCHRRTGRCGAAFPGFPPAVRAGDASPARTAGSASARPPCRRSPGRRWRWRCARPPARGGRSC